MLRSSNSKICIITCALLLPVFYTHHLVDDQPIPIIYRERVFSGSRNAPMAAWFNSNSNHSRSLITLQNHFEGVDDKLSRGLRARLPYGLSPDDLICNTRKLDAEAAFRSKVKTLGLPPVNKNRCITELKINMNQRQQDKLWTQRWKFIEVSKMAGRAAVSQLGLTNWSDAYTHANFTYDDSIHRCEVLHNVGFRVNGVWGVMLSVTQFPMSWQRRDRRREYQTEYLTYQNGKVGNFLVSLPNLDRSGTLVNDTTTTRENWRGTPAASIFREVHPLAQNPALSAVLRSKQEWREQVESSRSSSNIAIMVLSCLFTLVPISLFTEASPFVVIVYAIITDVMSCLPLAIKGVELMQTNKKNLDTVVWAYGLNRPIHSTVVVESWSARCTAKNDVHQSGVGFFSTAAVFMIIGILIEILMIKRLIQLQKREQVDNENLKPQWCDENSCLFCSNNLYVDLSQKVCGITTSKRVSRELQSTMHDAV